MIYYRFSEMSGCFYLQLRPLCHNWSSAFEMHKNITWTSRLSSKDLEILLIMTNNNFSNNLVHKCIT